MHPNQDDILNSVARRLETDRLLGVTSAPLSPPAGGIGNAPATPSRGAVAPAASSEGAKPVQKSQAISEEAVVQKRDALAALDEQKVKVCQKCGLHQTRTNTVFGQGNPAARLVFVGEAPGADEDAQGLAFVGRAGQLLTKMIEAGMGLSRDDVFICNILKCRPPENRNPAPDEVSSCWPHLDEQLRIIQPEVIVALGKPASQTLLRTTEGIGRLRGQWHDYYVSGSPLIGPATPLMPTYHPAYLLRSPGEKGKAWSDLKMVMAKLDLPVPQK